MTIHDFDMARYFLGEVVEVTATGANLISDEIAAAGDIDGAVVVLRGAGAPVLDHQLAPLRVRLRPAPGGVRRARHAHAANQLPTSVRFSGAARTEVAPPYHNFFLDRYTPAYRAEMDHFVTAVETGSVPSPGFADGRAALVLADAANESLRTGATVKVSGDVTVRGDAVHGRHRSRGDGHPDGTAFWTRFADALREAGYNARCRSRTRTTPSDQRESVTLAVGTLRRGRSPILGCGPHRALATIVVMSHVLVSWRWSPERRP